MKQALEQIKTVAIETLEKCDNLKALDELKVKYLGKKGELTAILKQMGKLSAEERPVIGQLANEVRATIEEELKTRIAALKEKELAKQLAAEKIDVTMPGKKFEVGKKHPLTLVMDEIKEIFLGMGFDVVTGPEVELDYYNFEALNIPKNHPAGHLLYQRKCSHENANLPGAGSYHGKEKAADPHHLSRTGLPFRRSGCYPFSCFPPDRRPCGR